MDKNKDKRFRNKKKQMDGRAHIGLVCIMRFADVLTKMEDSVYKMKRRRR